MSQLLNLAPRTHTTRPLLPPLVFLTDFLSVPHTLLQSPATCSLSPQGLCLNAYFLFPLEKFLLILQAAFPDPPSLSEVCLLSAPTTLSQPSPL